MASPARKAPIGPNHKGKTETEEKLREPGGKGQNQKGTASEAGAFCATVVASDAPVASNPYNRNLILRFPWSTLGEGEGENILTGPPENRCWLSSGVYVALAQKIHKQKSRSDEGVKSKPQSHPPETK